MITLHTGPSELTAEERILIYTHAFCLYVMRTRQCNLELAKLIMADVCAEAHEMLAVTGDEN